MTRWRRRWAVLIGSLLGFPCTVTGRRVFARDRQAHEALEHASEGPCQGEEPASSRPDDTLCAEHRDGKPGEPHEWQRGRRGRARLVLCRPPVVIDIDDSYYHGQTLPDALADYSHVHSTTGICVKHPDGRFCGGSR